MATDPQDAPVLPWRKVYPRDRQSDVGRKLLGLEGQAIAENLFDAAWLNGGTLPKDEAVLALLSQAGERWRDLGPKVLGEYFEDRDGVYVNADILAELQEGGRRVEFNRARAKAGAAARWATRDASSNAQSNAGNDACDMPPSAVQPSAVQPLEDSPQKTETDPAPPAPVVTPVVALVVKNGNGARTKTARVEVLAPRTHAQELEEDWKTVFGGEPPFARIRKMVKKAPISEEAPAVVRAVWQRYLRAHAGYASPEAFLSKYGVWKAEWEGLAPGSRLTPTQQTAVNGVAWARSGNE